MTASEFKYKAFISYSHADRRWGDWLHRALENYRVPRYLQGRETGPGPIPARVSPVFRDREELPTATDLGDQINAALSQSECMIVICSRNAAQSKWVNEEILHYKRLGRASRIFCLIVDGEPFASDSGSLQDECFPEALRFQLGDDGALGSTGAEPLAADVRASADGKSNAKLKLLAGILDVGFDELKQRDLQKRHRLMALVTAGSLAAVIVTSWLAISAIRARDEAETQRSIAETERETALQTTNFMIGLFEVADPSEARGRTITVNEILDRGVQRIRADLKEQPAVQSSLMQTMGKAYTGLGSYAAAETLLAEALQAKESSSDADPFAVINARNALGMVVYLAGRYDESGAIYQRSYDALQAGLTEQWREAHVESYTGLAASYTELDKLDEAAGLYRHAIERSRETWGADSEFVAAGLNGIGRTYLYQNDLENSVNSYREALRIYRLALGENHPTVAEKLNDLAVLSYLQRDFDAAISYSREALQRYQILLGDKHPEVASVLNNLGRIELEFMRTDDALNNLRRSVAIDRAHGRDRHDDLVYSLNSLALAEAATGNKDAADNLFTEATTLATERKHRLLGPVRLNHAELMCSNGDNQRAIEMLASAGPLIADEYGEDSWRHAVFVSVNAICRRGSAPESVSQQLVSSYQQLHELLPERNFFVQAALRRLLAHHQRNGDDAIVNSYRSQLVDLR